MSKSKEWPELPLSTVAKLPLGLMQDQVKPVDELAEQFPELKEALTEMAGGQLAASTLSGYRGAVARYWHFCEQQGYEVTELTKKRIIHYAKYIFVFSKKFFLLELLDFHNLVLFLKSRSPSELCVYDCVKTVRQGHPRVIIN